ncbi:hypothetical protein SLS62_003425 [Diatrype stigma]|uniref:Fasciclin domain family protein n=1 Tax=Diatrype stigma TaxID=117547 RepID=A0AAN9YRG2_9PEZI
METSTRRGTAAIPQQQAAAATDVDVTRTAPLPLDPVPGATLYDLEISRRRRARGRGPLRTGCREIDEEALLGGFGRGCVVGISAEEVDFGVLVGLQTIAHSLVFHDGGDGDGNGGDTKGSGETTSTTTTASADANDAIRRPRVTIITTLAATAILPLLRDVVRAQVLAKLGEPATTQPGNLGAGNAEVRACLECISISQVFDIEGLWEVLSELEMPPLPPPPPAAPGETGGGNEKGPATEEGADASRPSMAVATSSQKSPSPPPPPPLRVRDRMEEIGDSEDEGDELSPSPSPPHSPSQPPSLPAAAASEPGPPAPQPQHQAQPQAEEEAELEPRQAQKDVMEDSHSHMPDIILVTHFSSLLTTLFTQRDKASAHSALNLLSTHLRYLARSSSSSSSSSTTGPLIMLLNSTSFSPSPLSAVPTNPNDPQLPPPPPPQEGGFKSHRPLDPTLRSIFNPPGATTTTHTAAAAAAAARRNKPAYGATFAQFLDLHLLCTRVPRGRADADAEAGATATTSTTGSGKAWVVEVLLDEVGVWDWKGGGGGEEGEGKGKGKGELMTTRRFREQRWGAVDVSGRGSGVRIVDAFRARRAGAGV